MTTTIIGLAVLLAAIVGLVISLPQHRRDLRRWRLMRTPEGRWVLAAEELHASIKRVTVAFQITLTPVVLAATEAFNALADALEGLSKEMEPRNGRHVRH